MYSVEVSNTNNEHYLFVNGTLKIILESFFFTFNHRDCLLNYKRDVRNYSLVGLAQINQQKVDCITGGRQMLNP